MPEKKHWIKAWRQARGLSREAFAAKVRTKDFSGSRSGTGCSERLIEILEDEAGVTHPKIATRIAKVTGATRAQWNSIVPEKYRRAETDDEQAIDGQAAKRAYHSRSVVCIRADGSEIGRYRSAQDAAVAADVSDATIYSHCAQNAKHPERQFKRYGCSWRYADEWDKQKG